MLKEFIIITSDNIKVKRAGFRNFTARLSGSKWEHKDIVGSNPTFPKLLIGTGKQTNIVNNPFVKLRKEQ